MSNTTYEAQNICTAYRKRSTTSSASLVNTSQAMSSATPWCLSGFIAALVIFFFPTKVTSLSVTLSRKLPWQVRWKEKRFKLFNNPRHVLEAESLLDRKDRDLLSDLVRRRAKARARGDYAEADALKDEIYTRLCLPDGVHLQISDVPRREGGGSMWKLIRTSVEPLEGPTVLQLAHAALGLAMASSENKAQGPSDELNTLVDQAKVRRVVFGENRRYRDRCNH